MHHVPQRHRKKSEQDQKAKKAGHMYGDVIEYTRSLVGLLQFIAQFFYLARKLLPESHCEETILLFLQFIDTYE